MAMAGQQVAETLPSGEDPVAAVPPTAAVSPPTTPEVVAGVPDPTQSPGEPGVGLAAEKPSSDAGDGIRAMAALQGAKTPPAEDDVCVCAPGFWLSWK
jgi:hypothetical protein